MILGVNYCKSLRQRLKYSQNLQNRPKTAVFGHFEAHGRGLIDGAGSKSGPKHPKSPKWGEIGLFWSIWAVIAQPNSRL
jgi:hypothetical protein